MPQSIKQVWFKDLNAPVLELNETAVRIRAGIMMMIPLFMVLTLFDVLYSSHWVVDASTLEDTFEVDAHSHIIYTASVTKRVIDYQVQTYVLLYALFEILVSFSAKTAWLSPTIQLSTFLARSKPAEWKPIAPKRFAWGIGLFLVTFCLIFFNPDTFASMVNTLVGSPLLPTTYNYIPIWIPVNLVWICLGMIWAEAVLGFCVGCKIHALLVKVGWLSEPCLACQNIDWEAIQARHEQRSQNA